MTKDFSALCIEIRSSDAKALMTALQPEITFDTYDHTKSILKAVRSHQEVEYHICMISEYYSLEDVRVFFEDIRNLNRDYTCVFVQVRREIEPGFDRYSLKEIGIDYVISYEGTDKDKEGICQAIEEKLADDEIKERVLNVDTAMALLLKEIDRAAESKKRGRDESLNVRRLSMDFISLQTEFDSEVLQRYFTTLAQKTSAADPSIADELEVPEVILKKELPHLSEKGYKGASHRVWTKLQKLHGVKKRSGATTPNSEPEPGSDVDSGES